MPHVETSLGTVACLGLVKGADMWIANLGDCLAVLSRDGTALAISRDRIPDKHAAEAERLQMFLETICFLNCMSKFQGGYVMLRRR